MEQRKENFKKEDIAASFQKVATDILIQKAKKALKQYDNIKTFVVAGGVAANSAVRDKMTNLIQKSFPFANLILPKLSLCGDNAAMIGMCAYYKIMQKEPPMTLDYSSLATYNIENF